MVILCSQPILPSLPRTLGHLVKKPTTSLVCSDTLAAHDIIDISLLFMHFLRMASLVLTRPIVSLTASQGNSSQWVAGCGCLLTSLSVIENLLRRTETCLSA